MRWVKTSERMPPIETNGNVGNLTIRYKTKNSKGEELFITTSNQHLTVKYLSQSEGTYDLEWLDEDPVVLCSHCGDEIEAPICKNCEMELTMPTNEY